MAPEGDWLLEATDARWLEMVARRPEANIFHHPAWLSLLHTSYGYRPFVLAAPSTGGRLGAAVPCMEVNSPLKGRRWAALPFSDHCAPLWEDEDALRRLGEEMARQVRAGRIGAIELRGYRPETGWQKSDEYAFHSLKLRAGAEDLLRGCHSTHRRNIRLAQQAGVRTAQGTSAEHMEQFYRLHVLTRRRQGAPVQPRRFFAQLRETLLEPGLGFILLAQHQGRCIAAAVFLHWQKTLTYKFGASDPEALSLRPNNLLFWDAIQWGHQNGFEQLDMGRSDLSNTGLRAFKSRWGAQESLLTYATFSAKPVSAGHGKWLGVLRTIIQHSPPLVCRLTGEILYKLAG